MASVYNGLALLCKGLSAPRLGGRYLLSLENGGWLVLGACCRLAILGDNLSLGNSRDLQARISFWIIGADCSDASRSSK